MGSESRKMGNGKPEKPNSSKNSTIFSSNEVKKLKISVFKCNGSEENSILDKKRFNRLSF